MIVNFFNPKTLFIKILYYRKLDVNDLCKMQVDIITVQIIPEMYDSQINYIQLKKHVIKTLYEH